MSPPPVEQHSTPLNALLDTTEAHTKALCLSSAAYLLGNVSPCTFLDSETAMNKSNSQQCYDAGPPPYGSEVIGRKMSILMGKRSWTPAEIKSFDADTGKHHVAVAGGAESWISLGGSRFKWTDANPANASPNPSFAGSPQGEDAVARGVRVFWPDMGRYYQGVVTSFDSATNKHRIDYRDGDWAEHDLRHEAVVWLDDSSAGPITKTRGEQETGMQPGHSSQGCQPYHSDADDDSMDCDQQGASTPDRRRLRLQEPTASDCRKRSRRSSQPSHTSSQQQQQQQQQQGKVEEDEEEEEEEEEEGVDVMKLTVGARIAMSSDGGTSYLRARMSGYHPSDGRHRIRFDDTSHRLLNMRGKPFVWLAPRSRAAGYCARLHAVMVQLGAVNILPTPCSRLNPKPCNEAFAESSRGAYEAPPKGFDGSAPVAPEDAVGRQLCLLWQADGHWYQGHVLQYSEEKEQWHVLYCDGEEEWVDWGAEKVAWGSAVKTPLPPMGVCFGSAAPTGRAVIGWRVSVYWKEESKFYDGTVTGYDSSTGRYQVEYDDGQEEPVSPSSQLVVWKAPPGGGSAAAAAQAQQHAGAGSRSKRANAGKGGRAAVQMKRPSCGRVGRPPKTASRLPGRSRPLRHEEGSSDFDDMEDSSEDGAGEAAEAQLLMTDSSDSEGRRQHPRGGGGAAGRGGKGARKAERAVSFGSPLHVQVAHKQVERQASEGGLKKGAGFASPTSKAPAAPSAAVPASAATPRPPTPPLSLPPSAAFSPGFSFPAPAGASAASMASPNAWAAALLSIQRQLQQAAGAMLLPSTQGTMPPPALPPSLATASSPGAGDASGSSSGTPAASVKQQQTSVFTPSPHAAQGTSAAVTPAAASVTTAGASFPLPQMTAVAADNTGGSAKTHPAAAAVDPALAAVQPALQPDPVAAAPPPELPLSQLQARASALEAMLQLISKGEVRLDQPMLHRQRPPPVPRWPILPLGLPEAAAAGASPSHTGAPVVTTAAPACPAEVGSPPARSSASPPAPAAVDPSGRCVMIAPTTARKTCKSVRISSGQPLAAIMQHGKSDASPQCLPAAHDVPAGMAGLPTGSLPDGRLSVPCSAVDCGGMVLPPMQFHDKEAAGAAAGSEAVGEKLDLQPRVEVIVWAEEPAQAAAAAVAAPVEMPSSLHAQPDDEGGQGAGPDGAQCEVVSEPLESSAEARDTERRQQQQALPAVSGEPHMTVAGAAGHVLASPDVASCAG